VGTRCASSPFFEAAAHWSQAVRTVAIATTLAFAAGTPGALAQTVLRTIPNVPASCIEVAADFDGDGYVDLLVGNSSDPLGGLNAGAVRIVSGKHIVTGAGPAVLATLAATTPQGALGTSVAWITGSFFAVGVPGYGSSVGRVHLCQVDSTGTSVSVLDTQTGTAPGERLGVSLATVGDWDGNALPSVAVGAASSSNPGSPPATVKVFRFGFVLFPSFHYVLSGPVMTFTDGFSGSRFGQSLSAADFGDLAGNGARKELVVSAPSSDSPIPPYLQQVGTVRVYAVAPGATAPTLIATTIGDTVGNFLGVRVDAGGDFDGDGVADVIATSGALVLGGGSNEALNLFGGSSLASGGALTFLRRIPAETSNTGFDRAPRWLPDVNGDGKGDVLAGAPYYNANQFNHSEGTAYVFSGETGHRLMQHPIGQAFDNVGNAVASYPGGLMLVGSGNDSPSKNLYVLSFYPAQPSWYCTSKTNSLGCTPLMASTGSPDVNSGAAFDVRCTLVLNQKNGLLFYGFAPLAAPFQGGWLCVAPPTQRTLLQSSGGSASGNDCTGQFHYDFNARIQSGVDPALVVGQEVFCQYWSRDPAIASTTSLSNALGFVVNP
jgi:hypothetical protein